MEFRLVHALDYGVEHCVRQVDLGSERHLVDRAVGTEQDGLVVVGSEHLAGPHVVDDEEVAPLAGQLGPGVLDDRRVGVAGLSGEPDDDGRLAGARGDELGQDVGILDEPDLGGDAVGSLLDLGVDELGWAKICRRCGHDDGVSIDRGLMHVLAELFGADDT